jgi:hypothetical protein
MRLKHKQHFRSFQQNKITIKRKAKKYTIVTVQKSKTNRRKRQNQDRNIEIHNCQTDCNEILLPDIYTIATIHRVGMIVLNKR